MSPGTLGRGSRGCYLPGCLGTDEDAILSPRAIWAPLIRERGTGQLRAPGDWKFYAEPVRSGPGKMTFSGGLVGGESDICQPRRGEDKTERC